MQYRELMKRGIKMKKIFVTLFALMIVVCAVTGCTAKDNAETNLWESATYTENTSLGEGARSFELEVKVLENTVTFTVSTDKETVGEALEEHGIVSGEEGPYGLYIKKVNGITADYDVDQSYWSFTKNGEYMTTGADKTEIENGAHYELVYTK